MKKALLLITFLLVTLSVTKAQFFSAGMGTGIALNLQSNSNQSVFGFNFIDAYGQYTFNPLFATRFHFQLYDFLGKTTTDIFNDQISTDAALIINIKADFLIGNLNRSESINFYGYVGPGIAIPTGGGGPFFYIDFGGGASFKVAHNVSIFAETGLGIITSSPAGLMIPFRGGVKFDF